MWRYPRVSGPQISLWRRARLLRLKTTSGSATKRLFVILASESFFLVWSIRTSI